MPLASRFLTAPSVASLSSEADTMTTFPIAIEPVDLDWMHLDDVSFTTAVQYDFANYDNVCM